MRLWATLVWILVFVSFANASVISGAKSLGNGIYYFDKEAITTLVLKDKRKAEMQLLRTMLVTSHWITKKGNSVEFNEKAIYYKPKNLYFHKSSGKSEKEFSANGYFSKKVGGKWKKFSFVALFDKKTSKFKALYYYKGDNSTDQTTIVSPSLTHIAFTGGKRIDILEIKTSKKFSVIPSGWADSFYLPRYVQFSKNGKYLSFFDSALISKEIHIRLMMFSLQRKTQELVVNFGEGAHRYADSTLFVFSQDEKIFVYKRLVPKKYYGRYNELDFHIYDLEKDKEIEQFGYKATIGKNNNMDVARLYVDGDYILASHFVQRVDGQVYAYDTKNRKLFTMKNSTPNGQIKGIYHTVEPSGISIVSVKNRSFIITYAPINEKYELIRAKVLEKNSMGYAEVTQREINAVAKLLKIIKLKKAGFKKRANKQFKKLMINDSYDLYADNKFLLYPFDSAQVEIFAFLRRMKDGVPLGDYTDLQDIITIYIKSEAKNGLSSHVQQMIKKYKKLIGKKPSKYQKNMLAIYEATYLLDIGKDEEAYDKLFDTLPLEKKVLVYVERDMCCNSSNPLYKDKDKIEAIFDISLKKSYKSKYKRSKKLSGYDIEGNFVEVGKEKRKNSVAPTKKQDAIKLLD